MFKIWLQPKNTFILKQKRAYKNGSGSQSCKLFWNGFWFWLDERSLKFQLGPTSKNLDIGSKCCFFGPRPQPYRPLFWQIIFLITFILSKMSQICFSQFRFASPKIIGVKVCNRQADKFFDTIYGCMWIFYFSSICYLPYSLCSQEINYF